MKLSFRYLPVLLVLVCGVSCKDFLNKQPANKIAADDYFANETDLKLAANGLLNSYLPSWSNIALGDMYTDFVATKNSDAFYQPGIWDAERQTGWASGDWAGVRRANYMIAGMVRAQETVSPEIYNHYLGVARFWRAFFLFAKMKSFGDIPWVDHVISEEDPMLFAGRDDREFVFHKILEDLDFAGDNCLATNAYVTASRTLVNKWVVLAFKSQACLFEASYRKYHSANPSTGRAWTNAYETSEQLYGACIDACREIIGSGVFSLHTGNVQTAYGDLFQSETIPSDEVIWSRQASERDQVMHNVTVNYTSPTAAQRYSPTKELVNHYLKLDGTPITTDKVSVTEEFNDRDWRLPQTLIAPGHTWIRTSGVQELKAPSFSTVLTGYAFCKWVLERERCYSGSWCNNSLPIFRYGGILLDYAEAMAETGAMNQEIWSQTIGALRERSGVRSIFPPVHDPMLAAYYASTPAGEGLSDILLEVRRERAVELATEYGSRRDDLKRWALGPLIVNRYNGQGWRGIWISQTEARNGLVFNGTKFTFGSATSGTSATNYPIANTGADATYSLSETTQGYIIFNYKLEWNDKMYVNPIPQSALTLNPALGQNFGWE